MAKLAVSFTLTILSKDERGDEDYAIGETGDVIMISDDYVTQDCIRGCFDPDIFEAFKEHCAPSIELLSHSVATKDYHVFLYGSVSEDWSYHHEFGRDFDGWLFEIEHFVITRIGV